jgi:hypothetical protein
LSVGCEPDAVAPQTLQHALEDLPVEVLIYLLVCTQKGRLELDPALVVCSPANLETGPTHRGQHSGDCGRRLMSV